MRNPETWERQLTVAQLQPGMMVDLEGDEYADKSGNHPEYEFEYAVVDQITRESADCILVEFDNSACGFPPDHVLNVKKGAGVELITPPLEVSHV